MEWTEPPKKRCLQHLQNLSSIGVYRFVQVSGTLWSRTVPWATSYSSGPWCADYRCAVDSPRQTQTTALPRGSVCGMMRSLRACCTCAVEHCGPRQGPGLAQAHPALRGALPMTFRGGTLRASEMLQLRPTWQPSVSPRTSTRVPTEKSVTCCSFLVPDSTPKVPISTGDLRVAGKSCS